ncbi:hypothetical protein C9439_06640 [archaeon SCG-AAA382B04]|nr:hypothetical protein C9439_06640 [archaeon SCG-AAA382B04]
MRKIIKEVNLSNLLTITSLLLGIMAFIIVVGIFSGANKPYYNFRVGFIMYFLMLTMTTCLLLSRFGRKDGAYTAIGAFIISLIFVFTSMFNNFFLDATIPLVIVSAFASLSEIYRNIQHGELLDKIKNVSPHIIHLAVVILITGVLLTSIFATTTTLTFTQDGQRTFEGYTLKYDGFDVENLGFAEHYNYEFSIYKDGSLQGTATIKGVNKTQISWRPGIYNSVTEDIYLSLRGTGAQGISINAKMVPYPILLWMGVVLLATGITMRLGVSWLKKREKPKKPHKEKTKKSYDEKIEEELEKIREEKES